WAIFPPWKRPARCFGTPNRLGGSLRWTLMRGVRRSHAGEGSAQAARGRVRAKMFQRLVEQRFSGLHSVPGRSAGRVRQRKQIEFMRAESNAKKLSDNRVETHLGKKLFDGQFAHGKD